MEKEYFVGTRVKVFDPSLFINDEITPLTTTMKEGTVVCWYGCWNWDHSYYYDNLIDVKFDYKNQISHGHIIDHFKGIEIIG